MTPSSDTNSETIIFLIAISLAASFWFHVYNPVGVFDNVKIVFNDDGRITDVYQTVYHGQHLVLEALAITNFAGCFRERGEFLCILGAYIL